MSEPLKTCGCGRTYTAEAFAALPNRQEWRMEWGEVLEQRDCPCGSSITIQLEAGEPEEPGGVP
jgi:hypothetical protein